MMKFVLGIGLLLGFSAFAMTGDELVYERLNVEELPAPTPRGYDVLLVKSVGGVTCKKWVDSQTKDATFYCSLPELGPSGIDSEELYKALSGPGLVVPSPYGTLLWIKKVEWIDCKKTVTFRDQFTVPVVTSYFCVLQKS